VSLTVGSLFSGIGGLELGLERAGMRTVFQVERDEYCRRVLAHHWPDVPRFDDVRSVGEHNLPHCDLICGGYPCQPFSIAGLRRGESDERHLWPEFARIIREVRPRIALLENVPNHLGLGFGSVLGDLASLGYDAEWEVLSAGAFGAHHLRARLFVVAYLPDSFSGGLQGQWSSPKGPWTEQQLEGLVQAALRVSVPAGTSGGVSDGIPNRSHRLRALGNAVVPQVSEYIGRRILAALSSTQAEAA
jgi:DNA (cytosine-5)-methyltransferase 1